MSWMEWLVPSKEGIYSFVIERPCDRSIYTIIWRILGIKANNNNENTIGCEVVFFINLGIFDCNFDYCRWLLLFSLAQLNGDDDDDEEEENNTKNFHYWRIDELAVHLSCAVLRTYLFRLFAIFRLTSVDKSVISLSSSLWVWWTRICVCLWVCIRAYHYWSMST